MDILYILGKGSPFNNEEIKYSLRSLERFGSNIGKVVLIGEKPDFLDYSKIEHHPFTETGVKDYRIASKIMHACAIGAVKGDFLFCNDDFFFARPFDCNTFTNYCQGYLHHGDSIATAYQDHLRLTRDYLLSQGKSANNFDMHCPIIYNSEKFLALAPAWEYSKTTIGLVVKSTYANMYGIPGTLYRDVKLKELISQNDYYRINSVDCFSIYDQAWNRGVKSYLERTFTEKSPWEL
jgi:hypothetical protein